MRRLILLMTMLASAPAGADLKMSEMPVINPAAGALQTCPPISRYDAARKGGKLSPRMLDSLPAADLYKAVYRTIGGCVVPVIAGYGFGLPEKVRR